MLIIGAALAVPWQRMEQLTEELNQRAAGALADNALVEHARAQEQGLEDDLTIHPPPATRPAGAEESTIQSLPRLIPLSSADRPEVDRFDKRAFARFKKNPDSPPFVLYYPRKDGTQGYRFAQPVFVAAASSCAACHASPSETSTRPATAARQFPLVMEPTSRFAGILSVDISSRIQETQLLLNRVFILLAGTLAGALAIWSFYLITTRLILQPVRVLQETAEKVSQGDLNIRSDINTGDEFQQLSETFNTMLGNLKESADQLRAINKGLDLKLGQLAEANLALYESSRLKSEFLANVSHELRTPLNSILGFADLLRDAMGSAEPKTARYVGNILQSGRHLLDLINDLLDLAKIEAGKMEVRSEPLSLNDLFEGLTNILRPLTEAKQLSLTASLTPDVPIVQSDPGKLQQILYNFLANAIKFSPVGSRVELSAHRDGEDHVRISVTDHGPGIALDKQQLIFEKFRQVDASVTRTHGGTGLGLAISKELTALLGGSIGVRSTPGEGATFWVVVPVKTEAGAMDVRNRLVLT